MFKRFHPKKTILATTPNQAAMLLALALCFPSTSRAAAQGKAEHVVVVVWDGLRPDSINPTNTPTLHQLAQEGTFFVNHHSVFVSSTEVNGTALNTGMYPEHSGVLANKEYRPGIDRRKPIAMEDWEAVRRGDELSEGHFIATPTLAEIFQHAGSRTAVLGTKSVALLLDRSEARSSGAAAASVNFFKGDLLPAAAMPELVAANDGHAFPTNITYPNLAQDEWTTLALTRGSWRDGVPKFSVLWMSDPDYTQHTHGPGSPEALGALASVDRNLAVVLRTLEEKNLRDKTDVFVVSDHGFSTVERTVDVADELKKAGFNAAKKLDAAKPGDVLVVSLGGTVLLYVVGHDDALVRKLTEYFQQSDFAGVIFARPPITGTFPLDQVRAGTPNAPDLMVSLRWRAAPNTFGTPGLLVVAETTKKGAHASLSPFDMHNSLVAAGPDFRRGFRDTLPSGNADLAPTILWILGLRPPQPMDGRILSEALQGLKAPKARQQTIKAARNGHEFHWRQYLKFSTVGNSIYFDEGNRME